MVKNLPAVQQTRVQSLSREDPLEKGIAMHSSVLAWKIPWTEEPGELQSTGSQRVRRDCPWDFPGKNTGVSGHFLLQGIFPTQGPNPRLLHGMQILYRLSHQGSTEHASHHFKATP